MLQGTSRQIGEGHSFKDLGSEKEKKEGQKKTYDGANHKFTKIRSPGVQAPERPAQDRSKKQEI